MQNHNELDEMHIKAACMKLVYTFAHWIDARRYDDLLSLMTEDCMIEWPGHCMPAAALVDNLRQTPENLVSMHVITTTVFNQVTPDHAACMSYLAFYQGDKREDGFGQLDVPAVLGKYHDAFVHTAEGWRLSARTVEPTMMRN